MKKRIFVVLLISVLFVGFVTAVSLELGGDITTNGRIQTFSRLKAHNVIDFSDGENASWNLFGTSSAFAVKDVDEGKYRLWIGNNLNEIRLYGKTSIYWDDPDINIHMYEGSSFHDIGIGFWYGDDVKARIGWNKDHDSIFLGDGTDAPNVGIGTNNPLSKLHIANGGRNPVIIEGYANTKGANETLDSLPASSLIIGGPAHGKIYFYWKDEDNKKYSAVLSGTLM